VSKISHRCKNRPIIGHQSIAIALAIGHHSINFGVLHSWEFRMQMVHGKSMHAAAVQCRGGGGQLQCIE
jgi:hypothetical protein